MQNTLEDFDPTQARREGWDLFNRDTSPEIQRLDDGPYEPGNEQFGEPSFASDVEAICFVERKAEEGSAYHATALNAHKFSNH